jgi:hypothetical protein
MHEPAPRSVDDEPPVGGAHDNAVGGKRERGRPRRDRRERLAGGGEDGDVAGLLEHGDGAAGDRHGRGYRDAGESCDVPRPRARGDPHQLHHAVGGDVQVAEEVAVAEELGDGVDRRLALAGRAAAEATCLLTPLLEMTSTL